MTDVKIGIAGAAGRMGRMLLKSTLATPGVTLAAAFEAGGHELLGKDVGALIGEGPTGVMLTDDLNSSVRASDCIIDFTVPQATLKVLDIAPDHKRAHVIGTTGFGAEDEQRIVDKASELAIVKAGNMSLGVNLLVHLTRKLAGVLDEDFDIEILEMHHKHKVDAPSGTALMLGEAAAEGRGVSLSNVSERVRDGQTGARTPGDIGFAVLRGGEVVGEHSVMFVSGNERIELTHKAQDRGIFANGAVKAARWSHGKGPGLYSMADVLGFGDV